MDTGAPMDTGESAKVSRHMIILNEAVKHLLNGAVRQRCQVTGSWALSRPEWK